jgi:hypothetical protein
MIARRIATVLSVALIASTGGSPQPSPTPRSTNGIRVLRAMPNAAFGEENAPLEIAVLDDGSVMVRTDGDGLYRIVRGRAYRVWAPNPRCGRALHFGFSLAGSLGDAVAMTIGPESTLVTRPDGSKAFALPYSFEYGAFARGVDGVLWFLEERPPGEPVRAYFPATGHVVTLDTLQEVRSLFRSPNGRVYASNSDGLFELDARPRPRARMVHGPIEDDGRPAAVQTVGADGSLWASNPSDVIHVRPDGTTHVLRLITWTVVTRPPTDIPLVAAPDGSVWTMRWSLTRIDKDDRVSVLAIPSSGEHDTVYVGPDSSLWTIATARDDGPLGIVNFAPTDGVAAAWPLTGERGAAWESQSRPCPPSAPQPATSTTAPTPTAMRAMVFIDRAFGEFLPGTGTLGRVP